MFADPPSLPGDSPVVLVLVVSLCVLVVLLLVAVVTCVLRRRHKEAATSCGAADTEVRHNLMPGPAPDTAAYKCEQPLPPPPHTRPRPLPVPGRGLGVGRQSVPQHLRGAAPAALRRLPQLPPPARPQPRLQPRVQRPPRGLARAGGRILLRPASLDHLKA